MRLVEGRGSFRSKGNVFFSLVLVTLTKSNDDDISMDTQVLEPPYAVEGWWAWFRVGGAEGPARVRGV